NFTKEKSAKLDRVENKVDSVDIELEGARRRIADLERDKDKLKEDMNYVQSQSNRNNLIFGNIPEETGETPARSEQIMREFIIDKLKLAKEIVCVSRLHRMGQKQSQPDGRGATGNGNDRKHRSIVGKFCFFGEREQVRSNSRHLRGTDFYVSEQFPPEVAAKRRRLFKRVKEEKPAGRRAWVSYDTLYIDGRPVKEA
ncbi:LOW QUALITY PROTEIN: hypothetical protein MAR_037023, partial [Mya arenaria]